MFCHNCGAKIEVGVKFCHNCGSQSIALKNENIAVNEAVVVENAEKIVKCGNCGYEGGGEKARSILGQILAWLCIIFAPIITIIYFLATHKYRCPKCKSTFLGIKNKNGVFEGQRGSRPVLILVCVLVGVAIIGLLSSLAIVALGSARIKARDAKRLSDLKQLQVALELYYTDYDTYPAGKDLTLGETRTACLNAKGWQRANCTSPYMGVIPSDPSNGAYVYTADTKSYVITASFEGEINDLQEGRVKLTPAGFAQ